MVMGVRSDDDACDSGERAVSEFLRAAKQMFGAFEEAGASASFRVKKKKKRFFFF